MIKRNKLNKYPGNWDIGILRNKIYFAIIGEKYGIPVAKVDYLIQSGDIKYLSESNKQNNISFEAFLNKKNSFDFFIKSVDGECGVGISTLKKENQVFYLNSKTVNIKEVVSYYSNNIYFAQQRIVQKSDISEIYPYSINTLRIVTIKENGIIKTIPTTFRVGANKNYVDNWAKGGLIIPVKDNGKLGEYGFFKPGYGTKSSTHPNTGFRFNDFEIPYYEEAIKVAKKYHGFLDVHSIGWDIAITEDGPLIIEGNDNWEITLHQIQSPMRNVF